MLKSAEKLFDPRSRHPWMQSHASTPFLVQLEPSLFRLYFTCRDAANRSHIAQALLDMNGEPHVRDVCQSPVLSPGEPGAFDDCGVSMGCVVGTKLYYMGWSQGGRVPFRNSIGMAVWEAGAWKKVGRAPVLDRSEVDPFSLSYPFVLQEAGRYRMWYGSHLQWNPMRHVIKYAESSDGVLWTATGRICVGLRGGEQGEVGISRPFVWRDGVGYQMLFCFRGEETGYAIGHASSVDGLEWKRSEWSMAGCYPARFEHGGDAYLMFCSENYGRDGLYLCGGLDVV